MQGEDRPALLGRKTAYVSEYSPSLLEALPRAPGRADLRLREFCGYDLWRLYEITYLNARGIPRAAWGRLKVTALSPNLIESKSLKLYLGSFAMTRFGSLREVEELIEADLSAALAAPVKARLFTLEDHTLAPAPLPGESIDSQNLSEVSYQPRPQLLRHASRREVSETLRSNLLRTLCPVTGQPDHASVVIRYTGREIDRASLLGYLVSLRNHRGFHEQCAELIFSDIKTLLRPASLCVLACFTRRGGIDINPLRCDRPADALKAVRAFRQ